MRIIFWITFSVAFAFILSCQNNKEPNYSIIPDVEFSDLKLIPGNPNIFIPDTLKLSLILQDGDFDLGVDWANTSPPFNALFVLNKITGQLIPVNDIPTDHSNLALYPDRNKIDTLPSLSCSRWLLTYNKLSQSYDTIYSLPNPNYMNIFVDLYTQENNQSWSYFDYTKFYTFPNCSINFLDDRFPPLPFTISGPFNYKTLSSKEGLLTFSISSLTFRIIFKNKKIKLRFSIQDRALHRSNVAETTEIQF